MRIVVLLAAFLLGATPAVAERLIVGLSTDTIPITSSFAGTTLSVFAVIQPDGTIGRRGEYDAIVIVRGPARTKVVHRRERVALVWINGENRTYVNAPSFYAALSNRELRDMTLEQVRTEAQLGIDALRLEPRWDRANPQEDAVFRQAFVEAKREDGLYVEESGQDTLRFLAPNVFRARVPLPANAPIGLYTMEVMVVSDGFVVGREFATFTLQKTGIEAAIFIVSRELPLFYGIATVILAIGTGWIGSMVFRRT